MFNIIVGAGAASCYGSGSGSDQKMRLRLRNTASDSLDTAKPLMEFFIKVRTLVRTYTGHGVQQYRYIHKDGDRGGELKLSKETTYRRKDVCMGALLLLCYVLNSLFLLFNARIL
jgi:hypothetical protein